MAPAQGWHAKSWSVPHFCVRTKENMRLPLTIDFPEHCAGGRSILGSIPRCQFDSIFVFFNSITERPIQCAAGVVVSCKIPILATRVRFPGGAKFFEQTLLLMLISKSLPPRRGIEPRPPAWQAGILTTRLSRTCWRREKSLTLTWTSPLGVYSRRRNSFELGHDRRGGSLV